jgi:alkylation response protein AidB-like acyl-CoA dehydrogenase
VPKTVDPPRTVYDDDHEQFRGTVATFIDSVVAPQFDQWEADHRVDRSMFAAAGEHRLLLFPTPEEFGGAGIDDFRFNAIVNEEFGRSGFAGAGLGIALQNDVVGPYLLDLTNDEQKSRWLPGLTAGSLIGAIAMTEPGTGSDLSGIRTRAVRDGGDYVINGAKTFISNGQNCDIVIVAARTGEDRHKGLSLIVVEAETPGFEKGRNLDKLGLHNLPQERLSLATTAVAAAEGTLARTLDYVTERTAFGKPIGSFQNSRFLLAELATELDIARVFVDHCVQLHSRGQLSPVRAAKAKWWTTELQVRIADRCLQLHGGYGYMREYAVSRAFVDSRIQTIYGGTTEIMKEIIGKDLGL